MFRRLAGFCVAATLIAPAAFAGPDPGGTRTGPTSQAGRKLILNLRLTASSALPRSSRQALVKEASTIWKNGHVELRWLAAAAAPDPVPTLRIIVATEAVHLQPKGERWTVGELLRIGPTRAIAVASIRGAQRVLDESQRFRVPELPAVRDYRLGVVLGRAIAHEIGHYLLQTNSHAADGLMRANFDAQEFAALATSAFRLDPTAEAYILNAAAQGPGWVAAAVDESFSYSQPSVSSANLQILPGR